MEIDGKVISSNFMDRDIKCPDCDTKCVLVSFSKIPEDAVDAAKKKGLFVAVMNATDEPIIGVCPKCTDLIKKVEKDNNNTNNNDAPTNE